MQSSPILSSPLILILNHHILHARHHILSNHRILPASSSTMPASQPSQLTQDTPTRPQRVRQPVSNPGMVAPSPDSRQRVSAEHAPKVKSTLKKAEDQETTVIALSQGENDSEGESPQVVKRKKNSKAKKRKNTTNQSVNID